MVFDNFIFVCVLLLNAASFSYFLYVNMVEEPTTNVIKVICYLQSIVIMCLNIFIYKMIPEIEIPGCTTASTIPAISILETLHIIIFIFGCIDFYNYLKYNDLIYKSCKYEIYQNGKRIKIKYPVLFSIKNIFKHYNFRF